MSNPKKKKKIVRFQLMGKKAQSNNAKLFFVIFSLIPLTI